jgi:hypothetical protein
LLPSKSSYAYVLTKQVKFEAETCLTCLLTTLLLKANKYYNKLDLSPAYYAAKILYPRYKHYLDAAWAEKPDWLESNNRNFQTLWATYKSLPKPRVRPKVKPNDINDAIDCYIDPAGVTDNEEDEYKSWERSEPVAKRGSDSAKYPIKYWVELQDRYSNLSKFAIDMLSIPGSSCECERMFSELGDLLEPRRRNVSPQLLAAILLPFGIPFLESARFFLAESSIMFYNLHFHSFDVMCLRIPRVYNLVYLLRRTINTVLICSC